MNKEKKIKILFAVDSDPDMEPALDERIEVIDKFSPEG